MDAAGLGNLVVGACWCLFELGMAWRRRSSSTAGAQSSDKQTFRLLWATISIAMGVGILLGIRGVGCIPGAWPALAFVGQALMIAGIAVRIVAVRTLGRFFTVDVAIHKDHRVVKEGIYALVRHPSYSGSILGFVGVGMCFTSWVTFVVVVPAVTIAFVYRIRVEERALLAALGEEYAEYSRHTARLVPGVY